MVLTSVPKGMRTVLFDGKDAPFDRKDPRLRPVPFAVGKPVFEEVVAVHAQVTSIIFSDAVTVTFDDPKPASKSQEKLKAGRDTQHVGAKAPEATAGQHFDPDLCPPSVELIEACEQGDVDAAAALLDRLEVDGDAAAAAPQPAPAAGVLPVSGGAPAVAPGATATGWTAEEVLNHPDGFERLMTPLHVAAAGGHVAVLNLLLQRGANPLAEDVRGRVPYLLASNKDTRDAFRRARAGLPERWDWDAARVPEPLTEVVPGSHSVFTGAGGGFARCGVTQMLFCSAGCPCLSRPKPTETVSIRKANPILSRGWIAVVKREAEVLAADEMSGFCADACLCRNSSSGRKKSRKKRRRRRSGGRSCARKPKRTGRKKRPDSGRYEALEFRTRCVCRAAPGVGKLVTLNFKEDLSC